MILGFCLLFQFCLAPILYSSTRDLPILAHHPLSGILLLYLAVFALPSGQIGFMLPDRYVYYLPIIFNNLP